jgi:FtsZ-binding cell division protein ZapB
MKEIFLRQSLSIEELKKENKKLQMENKKLQDELNDLKKKMKSVMDHLDNIQKFSVIGEIAFELEKLVKKFVLNGRGNKEIVRFYMTDFEQEKSKKGFELKDEEKKKWIEWKEKFGWNPYFFRSMRQLKNRRYQVLHVNAFLRSIKQSEIEKILVSYSWENVYCLDDAKELLSILCKMKESDQPFK